MTVYTTTLPTPVGPLALAARADVLVAAGFTAAPVLAARLGDDDVRVVDGLGDLSAAVRRYLDGELCALDEVPVDQPGGAFRQAAWKAMRAVPVGETITYAELAARAGSPAAVRAAGSACARNLVAVVVPCHRVVRTGGGPGGYAYGLAVKDWLLRHERGEG